MDKLLNILHLEDSSLDAELVRYALESAGINCLIDWVDNFSQYQQALTDRDYDLILADYSLPDCDGMKALLEAQRQAPYVPFLLVTGALGEEKAIDTIKAGVTDYVLKNNLVRLKMAVPRAIEEGRSRWEKLQAQTELKQSEERFDLAVRGSGAGIWDWPDLNDDLMWWSPRVYELFGFDDAEVLPTMSLFYSLLHPEDVAEVQTAFQRHIDEHQPYDVQYRLIKKQGDLVWLRSRGKAIWTDDLQVRRMAGYIQDITDRKKAENERRKTDEKYRAIINSAQEAVIMINGQGQVTLWNPAAEQILGYKSEEVSGRVLHDLILHTSDPKEGCLCSLLERAVNAGGSAEECAELLVSNKSGQQVPVELTANAICQDEQWYGIGVLRDISERYQAEQKQFELEQQLRQAQKMEAIGTLAGGIAHDFNNILASILGYSALVEKRLEQGSREQLDMQEVLAAAERAKQLVRQILTFSRKNDFEKGPVSIDLVAKEVLKLLRASLPSTIEIKANFTAEGLTVLGDQTQVHQIIMNLCTNAFHAMPEGGTLSVSLQRAELAATNEWDLPQGTYLELLVGDTGTGISSDILERIFDPYFTTKDLENGTGLGLSVVRGIVNGMGGEIKVSSDVGQGSTFTLLFPCLQHEVAVEEDLPTAEPAVFVGTEHLLLVDDEVGLVKLYKEFLEELGYRISVQTSSKAALVQIRANPQQFDLVLSDFTMPGMTGIELAQEIATFAPGLPIVLCSGLRMSLETEGVSGTGIKKILLKTDLFEQLPGLLRSLFD